MLDAIRFGPDKFFQSEFNLADEELDVILERDEAKTKEKNSEIEKKVGTGEGGLNALDFSIGQNSECKCVYVFNGGNYKGQGNSSSMFALDIGKEFV